MITNVSKLVSSYGRSDRIRTQHIKNLQLYLSFSSIIYSIFPEDHIILYRIMFTENFVFAVRIAVRLIDLSLTAPTHSVIIAAEAYHEKR